MTPSIMSNPAANNEEERILIKDVRNNGKHNVNVEFIVLEIERETKIKDGATVRCFKVADESGSMAISLWDEMGASIRPGDILRLSRGYVGVYRGCLTLYTGHNGDLRRVGEFCKEFSEEPNFSEPSPELLAQESQQHHQNKHLQNKNPENQHQQHQNKQQQSAAGKQERNQRGGGGGGGGGGNHYTPHHPGGNNKNNNNNAQPGTLQSFASKHLVGAPRGDPAFGWGAAGRPGGRNAASQGNATGVAASSATINASRDPRRAKR